MIFAIIEIIVICLQMWSMDYVQVPAEEDKPEEVTTAKEKNEKQNTEGNQTETKKRVQELVKQMSISAEGSGKDVNDYISIYQCIYQL